MSVPALWTAMSLALALGKDAYPTAGARAAAMGQFTAVQNVLAPYYPNAAPGWNLFPNERAPGQHNIYAATLGLMALLETRRAGLPWQGSVERRDRLILRDLRLSRVEVRRRRIRGWKPGDDSQDTTSEGLSLQIFGRLLDAHAEMGFPIDARFLREIPRHLAVVAGRPLEFPSTSGEFVATVSFDGGPPFVVRESINFPWYPWAADCAARWLRSAVSREAPIEERVAVQRALGHLVMALGDAAAARASSNWTFEAAEMLIGLSAMPAPVR